MDMENTKSYVMEETRSRFDCTLRAVVSTNKAHQSTSKGKCISRLKDERRIGFKERLTKQYNTHIGDDATNNDDNCYSRESDETEAPDEDEENFCAQYESSGRQICNAFQKNRATREELMTFNCNSDSTRDEGASKQLSFGHSSGHMPKDRILESVTESAYIQPADDNGDEACRNLKSTREINTRSSRNCCNQGLQTRKQYKNLWAPQRATQRQADEGKCSNSATEQALAVCVHRTDCLQADARVRRPVVRVHLLNAKTGQYLVRHDSPPVSIHGRQQPDYILPITTQAIQSKTPFCFTPIWDEVLIVNESIHYILTDDPPVLLMFEIVDLSISSTAGGWYRVAWAFLKPVGANNRTNIGRMLRLQLYKPLSRRSDQDMYSWWSRRKYSRYLSTLYVTLTGVTLQRRVPACLWPSEQVQSSKEENKEEGIARHAQSTCLDVLGLPTNKSALPIWSRLPAQSCKIPKERKVLLSTPSKGCFCLKFSNSGLHLACAVGGEHFYAIKLYTIPDGKENNVLTGHRGLIYELSWSSSDSLLLSSSADCTACIWNTRMKSTSCLQMLQHPSFVYSAQFHRSKSWLVATGCNDHVVRLWARGHRATNYNLIEELEGHRGFITTLCFDLRLNLLSADSEGRILMWSFGGNRFSRECVSPWSKTRELKVDELKGIVINKLKIHPGGRRLLIHARGFNLRMVDLETACVTQTFKGAVSSCAQTCCCVSPCGSLVMAPSEEGNICVWNADTGEYLSTYAPENSSGSFCGVDYHPREHMVAFCSYGESSNVIICGCKKQTDPSDSDTVTTTREIGGKLRKVPETTETYAKSAKSTALGDREYARRGREDCKGADYRPNRAGTGNPCLPPEITILQKSLIVVNNDTRKSEIVNRRKEKRGISTANLIVPISSSKISARKMKDAPLY